jgi:hypothetical protein
MIPSKRWFPTNLPARALWMLNFATQFALVATSLGFIAADITSVEDDNRVFQFLADIFNQLKAYEEAVRQYRIQITENDIGKPTPQFPAPPKFTLPVVVPTGIFERLDRLRTKIMAADGYTDEIGALLGILPTQTERPPESELKPVVTVTPKFSDYKYTVHATRMGKPGYKVQLRRMDSDKWTDVAQSQTADIELQATPTVAGQPESVQIQVLLMENNQVVGQPSDAVYVTLNP